MHATLRRYEGVDQARSDELIAKVGETLLPRLSEVAGFAGYYLIDAGDGVMTSISLFETSAGATESTGLVGEWVREQELETALPTPPTITSGPVIVHKNARLLSAV
jgi:hypothetical protein